jgi:hypothetical protein
MPWDIGNALVIEAEGEGGTCRIGSCGAGGHEVASAVKACVRID